MNNKMVRFALVVVMVLLVAVPVIACAPEEVEPAPVGKVIKVGHFADYTGPYSTIALPIGRGKSDYIRFLNDDEGGINGIRIEELWADVRADPSLAITTYRRFKGEGMVGMLAGMSPDTVAISSFFNRDKIPATGSPATTSLMIPPRYYYNSFEGPMMILMANGLDWYYRQWQKKGLDRPMRVALLAWDNPFGMDGADGVKMWVEQNSPGVDLVAEAYTSSMAMDYATEFIVIKDKSPDVVACSVSGGAYGMTARDAARAGLSADVPLVQQCGGFSPGNIALAGAEFSRVISSAAFSLPDEGTPGLKRLDQARSLYHPQQEFSVDYIGGGLQASALCEAIRLALDEVGYENLTGEAIAKKGFERIVDFDTGLASPLSYQDYPGDRIGLSMFRIWGWDAQAGKTKILADWLRGLDPPDIGVAIGE